MLNITDGWSQAGKLLLLWFSVKVEACLQISCKSVVEMRTRRRPAVQSNGTSAVTNWRAWALRGIQNVTAFKDFSDAAAPSRPGAAEVGGNSSWKSHHRLVWSCNSLLQHFQRLRCSRTCSEGCSGFEEQEPAGSSLEKKEMMIVISKVKKRLQETAERLKDQEANEAFILQKSPAAALNWRI